MTFPAEGLGPARRSRVCQIFSIRFASIDDGYTEDAVVLHGVLDDGIEFIQKPFTINELLHKIREVLDKPLRV